MEVRVTRGAPQVAEVARHEVVEPDDLVAFCEKAIGEVRPQKSGGASDEDGSLLGPETHALWAHNRALPRGQADVRCYQPQGKMTVAITSHERRPTRASRSGLRSGMRIRLRSRTRS